MGLLIFTSSEAPTDRPSGFHSASLPLSKKGALLSSGLAKKKEAEQARKKKKTGDPDMDCVPFTDSQCLPVFWLGFYKAELCSTCRRGLEWRQTQAFTCSSRLRSALLTGPSSRAAGVSSYRQKGKRREKKASSVIFISPESARMPIYTSCNEGALLE